jgi:endonuclease/exonuclease/phosphatase (EEP) superfamily protein YafD
VLIKVELQPRGGKPEQAVEEKPKKVRHRQWFGAFFWLFAAIAGLAAGRLGQLYPAFDVFSQFTLQFMAMAVAFAIAMVFKRFKSLIGIGLTLAFFVGYGLWPHFVSTPLQQTGFTLAPTEKALRVVHYNTYKNNDDNARIAKEILRLDGDVVSLLEISTSKMKTLLPLLQQAYPHQYDCDKARACNIAIVSKHPIKKASGREGWDGAPYALVELGGDFNGVSVVAIHTIRFPYSRAQLRQIRETLTFFETIPGEKIVTGDFNATPQSRLTKLMAEGAGLALLTELPTWPSQLQLPQLAIDHIFASSAFRVVANQQIGDAAGSDHYPIVLTLAYKPRQ